MRSQIAIAVVIGRAAAVVFAQNPGIKSVLAKCKNPPQPFSIPDAGQSANANTAPPDPVIPATSAIPGVLSAGQSWKVVWSWEGNNVDGHIAGDNGTVLFANNDASNVMQMDSATGLAGSFGIVFYGGWGTPSARNRVIAIPTIAQGYTGRAK